MGTNREPIIIHLEPALRAWVVARAKADDRSASKFVGRLLEEWAKKNGFGDYPEVVPREIRAAEDAAPAPFPPGVVKGKKGITVSQLKLDAERAKRLRDG